ncbi:prepilin-type N-terminal cleavage/methylation domain-containing protein [Myxococcaceae bacterium GXIMD 01537]
MRTRRGFTLLETVIALAILGLALMAIFDLNAGAVANHAYTKKLTVATLLARSKMTDLEQQLYDDGFPTDDEEESGDFSEEGWSSFKWRAKIIAPKTDGVSPDQLVGAIFNLPLGDSGSGDPLGGIASMFGGSGGSGGKDGAPTTTPGAGMGAMAGMVQPMFAQMVDQLTRSVREVHLTVYWQDGTQVESLDLVTHVVSLGPGSDRNGGGSFTGQDGRQPEGTSQQWVDPDTGIMVANPIAGPNGVMLDPNTRKVLMNRAQWLNQMNKIRSPYENGGRPNLGGREQR